MRLYKMKLKKYWFFVCFLLISCNAGIKYQAGLFLHSIQGTIDLHSFPEEFSLEDCFVLVIASQSIGVSLQDPLYTKRAYIKRVNIAGNYQFSPVNQGQIFLFSFFCPSFQKKSVQFSQTLGVEKITYNPDLQKDTNWQTSFQFIIRPFLEDVLIEERYLLSNSDALFLISWLKKVEGSFF